MVANDGLELLFTGFAVVGVALLLLSSAGNGARVHVRIHLPIRLPQPRLPFVRVTHADQATVTPMLFGFLAMFGLGGLFGRAAFGFAAAGRIAVAVAFGLTGAAFALAIFVALRRHEGPEPTMLQELVGRRAQVTVSIAPATRGTVRLVYDGAVQTLPAVAATPIARGSDVVIVAVRGVSVAVREMPPPA